MEIQRTHLECNVERFFGQWTQRPEWNFDHRTVEHWTDTRVLAWEHRCDSGPCRTGPLFPNDLAPVSFWAIHSGRVWCWQWLCRTRCHHSLLRPRPVPGGSCNGILLDQATTTFSLAVFVGLVRRSWFDAVPGKHRWSTSYPIDPRESPVVGRTARHPSTWCGTVRWQPWLFWWRCLFPGCTCICPRQWCPCTSSADRPPDCSDPSGRPRTNGSLGKACCWALAHHGTPWSTGNCENDKQKLCDLDGQAKRIELNGYARNVCWLKVQVAWLDGPVHTHSSPVQSLAYITRTQVSECGPIKARVIQLEPTKRMDRGCPQAFINQAGLHWPLAKCGQHCYSSANKLWKLCKIILVCCKLKQDWSCSLDALNLPTEKGQKE